MAFVKRQYENNFISSPHTSKNFSKYEKLNDIDSGTFGSVGKYKYYRDYYAIKKYTYKNSAMHITTVREIKNLVKMQGKSEYVTEIVEIVARDGFIHIVFPLYDKTLVNYKYKSMEEIKMMFRKIAQGVLDIHKQGIIHRDLKTANVMTNEEGSIIKIIDFGMSRKIKPSMSGIVVTLWYRAPEILIEGASNYKSYGFEVDVWSLGIILLEMCLGEVPFKGSSEIEQLNLLEKNGRDLSHFKTRISEDGLDLVGKMLNFNPKERIELVRVLEHPFLLKK